MIRRVTGIERIEAGRAGTSDPRATGVLVLCTGRVTKLIEQLVSHDKRHYVMFQLGVATPSFDNEYEIDTIYPYERIMEEMVRGTLHQSTGEIDQRPPSFPAVKVGGIRTYDLTRQG